MKYTIQPLVALALVLVVPACIFVVDAGESDGSWLSKGVVRGSGVELRETRTVQAFRRIASEGHVDLEVRIGEPQSVSVRADDNFVPWITTAVENDTLTIRWRAPNHERGSSTEIQPKVEIVVSALESLSISGSGDARIAGLAGPAFAIDVSGSGDVRADGRVDRLSVSISGSGDASLYGLEAREATVSVAGSGDVEVTAKESLRANVAGSGDVHYRGDPKDVKRSVAGSGSVERD